MSVQVETKKTIESIDLSNLNTSQKIRKLDSEGFTRGEISKFLGKRYQHVRNVLVTPLTSK